MCTYTITSEPLQTLVASNNWVASCLADGSSQLTLTEHRTGS